MTSLVLASTSASRQAMLTAAGVPFEALPPMVDEAELKRALLAGGADARGIADALAEAKAVKISRKLPGALVLGSDSVVALDDGTLIDKAPDRETLAAQLGMLRGRTHRLISAAVVAESGSPVWRFVGVAKLTMRDFSDAFLETYLDACGDILLGSVGGYHIEARGAQLFARVDGDQFTIRGLPLLAVLDYLRVRGVMPK
ncbi:Maf family protein [Sphingosinicella soli]|uniref:Nucleoside triphosphate pyrophosphatase n=1 Tax=Sphingosinicella soli TaxID=333708 RepID=A0A7W7F7V9_9SPHN|nr:nucleoside triphosphate pyrophosphatase [Sphingosinicella soli]MBB4633079.1 septum formation protein [Sphingosinicella soli]